MSDRAKDRETRDGAPGDRLWRCPECGHGFVTPNMWHSCSRYDLRHHFGRAEPHVREIFDRFLEVVEENGPVEVIPQKSRIAIMVRVRFAGCVVRRRWLLASLWMTREVTHPRLTRTERFGPRSFGHQFRLETPQDVDETLRGFIAEAYRVGLREHLDTGNS